jgi:hypothetical protein
MVKQLKIDLAPNIALMLPGTKAKKAVSNFLGLVNSKA